MLLHFINNFVFQLLTPSVNGFLLYHFYLQHAIVLILRKFIRTQKMRFYLLQIETKLFSIQLYSISIHFNDHSWLKHIDSELPDRMKMFETTFSDIWSVLKRQFDQFWFDANSSVPINDLSLRTQEILSRDFCQQKISRWSHFVIFSSSTFFT